MGIIKNVLKKFSIEAISEKTSQNLSVDKDTIFISLQDINKTETALSFLEKESDFVYLKDFNFINSSVSKNFIRCHGFLVNIISQYPNIEVDNNLLNKGIMLFKIKNSNLENNQKLKNDFIDLIYFYQNSQDLAPARRINDKSPQISLQETKDNALNSINNITRANFTEESSDTHLTKRKP